MSRLLITGLAFVSAVSLVVGESRAQTYYGSACCGPCGGATAATVVGTPVGTAASQPVVAQSYQRFSYAPAPAGVQSGEVYSQPAVIGSAPMRSVPTMQSYRSYSYQPMTSARGYSRGGGERWQYAKGDPRRQMH